MSVDAAALRDRARVLRALRGWFDDHGYLEVPTPVRVPSPALEPQLFALEAEGAWLRTSPEFALKRVLAAGLPRIYEIGPCFRGREQGPWHATEFTMLEWYRVGAALEDLMDEVEGLVGAAAAALGRPAPSAWSRTTVGALFRAHTGLDAHTAPAHALSRRDADDREAAWFRRWIEDVEPHLTAPTFVADWPADQAALARVVGRTEGPVARRFEAFLGGVELANAFEELTDAAELRARWSDARAQQRAEGEVPHPVDEALLDAVDRMPPTSGIALGVDRLVAVLTGRTHIDVGWS